MVRHVAQYRYGFDPANISYSELVGRDANSPLMGKSIIQLGIQAPSGVRFYLNGESGMMDGIVIDNTNLYELNVDGMTIITDITFDANTLQNNKDRIIIDIVYEGEEGII